MEHGENVGFGAVQWSLCQVRQEREWEGERGRQAGQIVYCILSGLIIPIFWVKSQLEILTEFRDLERGQVGCEQD